MNKIFKVIWSKVRNCYVAVSEIAKRNGKSCTSVNCGAKANRRSVGVTLAVALSLSMAGSGVAWAVDVPSNRTVNSPTNEDYVITGSGVKFIVDSGGIINSVTSSTSGNTIEVKAGGQVTGTTSFNYGVIGGQNNNNVTISGTVEYGAYGGFSESNSVTGNTVEVKNGTVTNAYGGGVGGGSFPTDTTNYDTGTVVRGNTITISGTGKVTNYLYGGSDNHGYSTITGNIVNIKDNSEVASVSGGDAYKGIVSGNSVNIYNGTVTGSIYGGNSGSSNISGNDVLNNTVTIYKGTFTSWTISGGDSNWGSANNNVVDIRDGVFNVNYITGGMASYAGGSANNNRVKIVGGTFTTDSSYLDIWGGSSSQSDACDNQVDLSNFNISNVRIRGGYVSQDSTSTPHFAQRNNIILNNTTVNGNIYGGYIKYIYNAGSKITNNEVTLNGVTGNINLYGGYYDGKYSEVTNPIDTVTGNKLILQKAGNAVSSINNFETIQLASPLTWSNGKGQTILTGSFSDSSFSKLDISPIANNLKNTSNSKGTMTILAGSTSSSRDFGTQGFTLKYGSNSNDTVTLNSANPKKIITAGTSGSETTYTNGVKFKSYKEKEYTVSLANNYKNVLYTIADNVTTIDLGTAKWGTPRTADATKNFVTTTTINASNLNFTFDSEADKSNLRSNSATTLLSNATGMIAGINANYGTGKTNHTQTIQYTSSGNGGNGVSLTGTLTGNVVTLTDSIEFQATNMTLDSVNLAGWDGTNLLVAPAWTKNPTNISVTTAGLSTAALTAIAGIPANSSRQILRRMEDQYFSNVQFDSASANNNVYKSHSFSNEQSSGSDITFTGTQNKGITVGNYLGRTNNTLVYKVDYKNVNTITLGGMTWGTSRTPSSSGSSDFRFGSVTGVDASGLTFNFSNDQAGALKAGSSMTLLSSATGLAAGKTITYDPNDTTKNSISQSVNYSIANVASLTGTLTGTVATVANAVKYTASSMTLDTVNFGSWNGSASGPVPSGWTASGTTAINALNLMFTGSSSTVNTNPMNNSMTLLSGATGITGNHITQPGSGKGIVTVSGYNDNNGVTFDGKAKGTVSVSSNNVIYTINSVAADKLTLGSFAWGGAADIMPTGWTASVSTTIDDTNFAYTGTANTKLKQNDTAVILNATGLTTNSEVIRDSGASATKTVAMDFTDSSGDGASSIRFTGTANGHVEAAADKVNYVVDGAKLDSIDLASWNGTTFNLDSTTWGWELAKDTSSAVTATVATAGMTEPSGLSAGEKKVIIEATGTDYFDGINIGEGNKWSAGTTLTDTAVLTSGGVTIAGTQTKAGVKVNEANKKQLVYEASKKNATSITLGKNSADASSPVTYVKNGTARSFDNTFDVSNADIYADNLTFTDASKALMETNDTMTIVDASGAIANSITGQKLQTFVGKTYVPIAFTDTITGKNLTFAGTHTDTLTQSDDAAKSKLIYTVGAKNVTTATLSGDITWGDNSVYYENGKVENQNGVKPNYVFGSSSAINIGGVQFSATTDPMNKSMTLLKGVNGVVETKISGTPTFAVALTQNNTKLDAKAIGSASVSGNDVIYSVNGVAIDKINVASIENAADTVPTGWTLAKDSSDNVIATVETDGLVVASPSGLEPGVTKVIIEAASGSTAFFKDVSVNGSHAWKVDGSTITSDLDIGGVAITGTQTKGGVKVNEANTNQIIYEESKKKINTLTLGKVTFKNDDGTASTVARSFDKTYDVSTATINADDLAFANSDIMETGNSMRIVDASAALPNAITQKRMPVFTAQDKTVNYTDTISGKVITFAGTHTDKLEQDAAQTKLTYTVGDKNVSTATLNGTVNWSDGASYYTNGTDVNQNNVAATYKFNGNTSVDLSGVAFSAAADPLAGSTKSMTLLKGVTGVVATKVSGTPSFAVTLDQTNTKLDAKATGSAAVSGSDVTYSVSGVAINKVNIKSVGSTADMVPANWTLAKDSSDKVIAKVETDGLSVSDPSGLEPGETKVLIKAADGATNYFNGVAVNGSHAWKVDGSTITSDLDIGGVAITGTQTKGGVKVNEANTNQIIYEESKKKINTLTLGKVTFKNDDGTASTVARSFDATYDVSTATISAGALSFSNAEVMETGNTMRIIDASAAIPDAISNKKLPAFTAQDKTVNYTDTISGKVITFAGTHTDKLEQDAAQTKLTYTVGDKNVSTATLNGTVNWSDGASYYTNGTDVNQNNVAATYKFNGNTSVDLSGVAFSAAADPLAGSTKSMTLLKGVTGVVATKVSGTPSFAVTLDQTNTKLDAKATGSAGVSNSDVTYSVSGVTINKVNIKSVGSTADTVPDNWTLANGATVETDDLVVASPSGLEPGETKVLIKAADGATNYFNGVSVNGNYAWKVDNSTITSDLDIGGVAITGTQTKGGVKVNEANTNQIIYEESKKKINTLTLGSVTFANDDGTAATVARTFDKTYDVSTATISADGLAFANFDTMETGNSMRIVDANATIPNAISNKKLSAFAGQTYEVAFSDTITGKNLTLKGSHTDTLSQDAAQTTLTYTVGDKKVSSATLTGDIAWNDGGTHYTNGSDANQNGTKATYTFDSNSSVDISGVQFNAMVDPLGKSMTLLKDVNGVVATKVSGTPSFAVALDQTNTKLDAKATGASGVSGNDVTFTVSGVTLDKITVKSANGTADKVPASWTMAAGATIETDSMNVPELAAGTHVDILQSDTDEFFANVPINGANAYGNTQETFTESDAAKSVSIAGTQDKGVTLNTEKKHLIYKAGTLDVASVTLGPAEWEKGATVFDRSGAGYNYAGVAALGTDDFAVSYASPETVATGDSMTLLQANKTLSDMAEQVKKTSYSYTPVTGVTIDANITGKLATSGGAVTYTAATNQAGKLTFANVDWKDSGALMTRPKNITFSGADVDTAKINFTNITLLDANKQMTLVSDFGDKVGTITGTKYMVGTTSEGEGVASLSGSNLIFTTKTGAGGAAEQTHRTVMATEAGIAALAAGQEYVDSAVEGLGMLTNLSPDGTSTFAAMGGGASRYKTGSHVDTRTWNAVVAVGSKREHKKGTFEWGVFAEYGKGNYTLHSDDGGRGDGDTHYAGGGLLAKWTNKHKVYTEASVRMGRISDSASNMLRDGAGNQYGYNVHANYYGGHIGIGKLFEVKKNRELDVYGKFFYTRRNGVSFNAAGRYDLDAVNSSLLRVGARYGSTDKKWNWYGGLAYEYQFDGESGGMLNGNTPIRAASIKGGSVRGEIGLRMDATKTNPWQTDISIYGYGGKHRGIGGSVNVAYMF